MSAHAYKRRDLAHHDRRRAWRRDRQRARGEARRAKVRAQELLLDDGDDERVITMPEKPTRNVFLRLKDQAKKTHPNALVLVKMGDFFEAFEGDAEVVARAAGLTLTARQVQGGLLVSMAGFPAHAQDRYVEHLRQAGHEVIILEPEGESDTKESEQRG